MAEPTLTPPAGGAKISIKDGSLTVPNNPIIPFIEGDGTGRDIWRSSVRVLDAAVAKAYGGERKIHWMEIYAGEKANNQFGTWLPEATVQACRDYLVSIKGPLTTPVGGGIRSLNVALRQMLDLYVCLRPVRWFKGVPSPVKRPDQVDMVIFRENCEDIYAGIEFEQGPQSGRNRGADMGDVVDLVLVEADRLHEIDLNFITRRDAADERPAVTPALLRDRKHGGNVVARMRIIGGEERVMEIELSYRRAVRPCRPLSADRVFGGKTEQRRAAGSHVGVRHGARRLDRPAIERGDGDRGVIDDAVDDHVGRFGVDLDWVGGDGGDLPGELVFALQIVFGTVGANVMGFHGK